MLGTERRATLLYVLAVLLLCVVGGMEYMQFREQEKIDQIARQEKDLKTKADNLRKREQAAEKERPVVAALEAQLLPPEKGNYYAQVLMVSVAAQRQAGVELPTIGFVQTGNAGKYPRFQVSGTATGQDEQVFEFIRLMEQGPYKAQVASLTYTTAQGAAAITPTQPPTPAAQPGAPAPAAPAGPALPPGGQASVQVTFVFTARQ